MSTRRYFLRLLSLLPLPLALSQKAKAKALNTDHLRLHKGWIIKTSDLKQPHR